MCIGVYNNRCVGYELMEKAKAKGQDYDKLTFDQKNAVRKEFLDEKMKELNSKKPIVSDKGFLSTSIFYNEIYMSSPANIFIKANKGDHAMYMDGILKKQVDSEEYGLLFNKGHKFRLLKIEAHPDRDEKHLDSPQFDVYLEALPESEQDK